MRFPSGGQREIRSVCVSVGSTTRRERGTRRDTETRDKRGKRWRDTHLLKSSTRYSIFLRSGKKKGERVRTGADSAFARSRSDRTTGGERASPRRTVVAFENTCCIMASFSAGESLDMSTGGALLRHRDTSCAWSE